MNPLLVTVLLTGISGPFRFPFGHRDVTWSKKKKQSLPDYHVILFHGRASIRDNPLKLGKISMNEIEIKRSSVLKLSKLFIR